MLPIGLDIALSNSLKDLPRTCLKVVSPWLYNRTGRSAVCLVVHAKHQDKTLPHCPEGSVGGQQLPSPPGPLRTLSPSVFKDVRWNSSPAGETSRCSQYDC